MSEPERIELWDDPSPVSTRAVMAPSDTFPLVPCVRNINRPTLTPHVIDGSDTAFIVCPGGGMVHLAIEHEGSDVCEWANKQGASGYVLEYRQIPTDTDADVQKTLFEVVSKPLDQGPFAEQAVLAGEDLAAAVAYVKQRHQKVVVVGFSAGARTAYEAIDAGVDAIAFIYSPTLPARDLSDAPPAWFAIAADDPIGIGPVMDAFRAWRAASRPAELHIFERGSHGFGMIPTDTSTDEWVEGLGAWLRMHKLI